MFGEQNPKKPKAHERWRLGSLAAGGASFCYRGLAGGSRLAPNPSRCPSPAFKDGTMMPRKFANNTAGNANCVGENISPALNWSNPPDGTKSFALTMVDPEGRGGSGVIHWVAYGISPSVTGFAEVK